MRVTESSNAEVVSQFLFILPSASVCGARLAVMGAKLTGGGTEFRGGSREL